MQDLLKMIIIPGWSNPTPKARCLILGQLARFPDSGKFSNGTQLVRLDIHSQSYTPPNVCKHFWRKVCDWAVCTIVKFVRNGAAYTPIVPGAPHCIVNTGSRAMDDLNSRIVERHRLEFVSKLHDIAIIWNLPDGGGCCSRYMDGKFLRLHHRLSVCDHARIRPPIRNTELEHRAKKWIWESLRQARQCI